MIRVGEHGVAGLFGKQHRAPRRPDDTVEGFPVEALRHELGLAGLEVHHRDRTAGVGAGVLRIRTYFVGAVHVAAGMFAGFINRVHVVPVGAGIDVQVAFVGHDVLRIALGNDPRLAVENDRVGGQLRVRGTGDRVECHRTFDDGRVGNGSGSHDGTDRGGKQGFPVHVVSRKELGGAGAIGGERARRRAL